MQQKQIDRELQISNQKDALQKEIFDKIFVEIQKSYNSLGDFRATILLISHNPPVEFAKYFNDLHDNLSFLNQSLHLLKLNLEQYSFMFSNIDELPLLNTLQKEMLGALKKYHDIKPSDPKEMEADFKFLLKKTTEINLTLDKIGKKATTLLKEIFDSIENKKN